MRTYFRDYRNKLLQQWKTEKTTLGYLIKIAGIFLTARGVRTSMKKKTLQQRNLPFKNFFIQHNKKPQVYSFIAEIKHYRPVIELKKLMAVANAFHRYLIQVKREGFVRKQKKTKFRGSFYTIAISR